MIDKLLAFRGKDYHVNSKIVIRQPTLDEISDYDEARYFSLVRSFCATPADRKVEIWDNLHVYWNQIDEWDLFASFLASVGKREVKDDYSILFPGLDVTSFKQAFNGDISQTVLINNDGVVIDRSIYTIITDYLRYVHRFKKNEDIGYDDYTKEVMIEDDRDEQLAAQNKPFDSILLPIISSLTNCSDFKYRFDDVWSLPIGAFMDSAGRVQKYRNFEHMMHGIYSGCVDIKKINKSELNWMGELK